MCLQAFIVLGDQPEGQMTVKRLKDIQGKECIFITYNIPSGIQTEAHPNPGKPFTGLQAESWLPNEQWVYSGVCLRGQKVLKLLKRAFEQKLIFTVAATPGAPDRVVFTDIPHARNFYECSGDDFLGNVTEALKDKFIE
ncbi:E3 ubiquitin-protein ligase DTX3L-like [Conger conger]|uniref:E3 ubiquitin-protein ligase DTX3L-like n=1 Tax=Conger conger TaxID=82655 RepID=UPI002A59C430|nr:E3 ubiquitin-protein ligase DTX3L-like [Conger conger]